MRRGVVILPERPWPEAKLQWQRAEELGFDHAWTYDHLAWRSLRDRSWFSAIPTLTAAALATTTIRLGPLVATPTFRHPVPFAKELMTLDDVAAGRLTLGVGAGADGFDADMLGGPAWARAERTARFVEFVDLLDALLSNHACTYEGRYYSANEARSYPGCIQQPRVPFAVAATGPRGMALAARVAQVWVTTGDRHTAGPVGAKEGAAMVAGQMVRLDQACARVGRDPAELARLVVTGPQLDPGLESAASFTATLARYEDVGVTDLVVHWPRPSEPFAGDLAAFERSVS
jgi:alkanesulfonate monooxygenase SsuD/methylene tetrahydromethanopterin reductase-like flavin-dependent oxidoreductase (luciferase family)